MYGGIAATAVPTVDIEGGLLTTAGSAVQDALYNVVLNGGTMTSATADVSGYAWHVNGTVTSHGASYIQPSSGSGNVSLQCGDMATPTTNFNVQDGTLAVSSPLVNGLSSSAVVHATGLTKLGAGTLTLTGANTYTGLTTVTQGTLRLGPPSYEAVLHTTTTGLGADIQGGYLVFAYSLTAPTPVDTVRANLLASYTAGSGSLVSGPMYTSTGSALGYGIGYVDDPVAMTVTAQVAVYGDTNLDGTVNILDLAALGQNWKQTGKHWADGDFNYDGTVNLLDLAILGQHWKQSLTGISFGAAAASAGFGTIPEPGTLALLGCGLVGLLAIAWRKRR